MSITGIAALISGAASALGAFSSSKQSKMQRKANEPYQQFQERKNQLIDELLGSLDGSGKYGNLFQTDENAFQKSFVDPAKQMFGSQIAPQIQQGSISGGMQRSSSLDDQLTRAGVDLDQMLNQNYMSFQNQGKDRMSSMLSNILGNQPSQPLSTGPSDSSIWGGAASGFLESQAFSNLFKNNNTTSDNTFDSNDTFDSANPRNNRYNRPGFKGQNY